MNDVFGDHDGASRAGESALAELALNLRWSWNHAGDRLWRELDADLWERTQNPWVVLRTISPTQVSRALADPEFRSTLDRLLAAKRDVEASPTWFGSAHADSPLSGVAYFSMEYMLSEALPIYSGGLGNVAGDQLKAASDLGVPVTALGLLYAQGYFRQAINIDGGQEALYPFNDPGQMPIRPLRNRDGSWVRFDLELGESRVWIRAWEVQVGRAKLFLLDTNDPANSAADRCITSELYGGGPELRLKQEIVLGIGGWRLLDQLGLRPEVCHLNEGHAAFAALERARCTMRDGKVPFDVALTRTRAGNVFTTHTAVAAGFDRFAPDLMARYFRPYAEAALDTPLDSLLSLGRRDPTDGSEPFNMAYLAIRTGGAINGVSKLHGEVSRRLFAGLFPRWPEGEVPVGSVTNGIHTPTWDSAEADALWTEMGGKERWRGALDDLEAKIRGIDDERLWTFRCDGRRRLSDAVAKHGSERLRGGSGFDADALTIGFARRFATYKRPNLLLHDPDRLARLLTGDGHRPVQLVLAGKAHPQDAQGQALIKQWFDFADRSDVAARVIFLPDYDMRLAQILVQGVDLWINTPLRPWEACGTSGMKVLVNGGLNLSELDGWWAEAYAPDVGWAIGDRRDHGGDPAWDAAEAEMVYSALEREVVPTFYNRGLDGVPQQWVARMRESMARLTPRFSANRAVREYTESFYLPAAAAFRAREADGGRAAADLLAWRETMSRHWGQVRFGDVQRRSEEGCHSISTHVYFGSIDPDAVQIELYADNPDGEPTIELMSRGELLVGSEHGYVYTATVRSHRPSQDYTPRAIPFHPGALIPLEAAEILWQG